MRSLTTEEFIQKSKEIHGDKYDYSKVDYVNTKTKVCIICPEHGEFWQIPNYHISGCGCPECGKRTIVEKKTFTNEEFIKKCSEVHDNKYDYSLCNYKGIYGKVKIICPIHGEFEQIANNHINGRGCLKCAHDFIGDLKRKNIESFISEAEEIHNKKYNYSKVEYVNSDTKVCVICPEHGEFWQSPKKHLYGQGCPKCGLKKIWDKRGRSNKDDFIKNAIKIHGNKYDYSKVEHEFRLDRKQIIICKEHGEFLQTPNKHLSGQGCPLCSKGKASKEAQLLKVIREHYNSEEVISNYMNRDILSNNKSYDIYLPKYKIAIEYQGKQHFAPVSIFGGYDNFVKTVERDKEKFEESKKNGVRLLYFTYQPWDIKNGYIDKVYTKVNELFEIIDEIIGKNEDV